ncbi:putative stress response RCI peptide, partial [Elsinoe ampelina]
LTLVNIVFPPATVLIVTGAGMDTLINCFLFLLAVIPSHVHGFYLTWVYFARRHRAKRGRYPGKPHPMIYSDKINNGG